MHILMLDDEPNKNVVERIEEIFDHTVDVAHTIEQALDYFTKKQPELILCDVNLTEGTTGFGFFDKVKDQLGTTRFVFMSGNSYQEKAEQVGAKFVSKPIGSSLEDIFNDKI